MYEAHSKDEIRGIFKKGLLGQKKAAAKDHSDESGQEDEGIEEDKLGDFRRGLSEYLLTKFYLKKKKEGALTAEGGSLLKEKFKVTFDVINKDQEGQFIKEIK